MALEDQLVLVVSGFSVLGLAGIFLSIKGRRQLGVALVTLGIGGATLSWVGGASFLAATTSRFGITDVVLVIFTLSMLGALALNRGDPRIWLSVGVLFFTTLGMIAAPDLRYPILGAGVVALVAVSLAEHLGFLEQVVTRIPV